MTEGKNLSEVSKGKAFSATNSKIKATIHQIRLGRAPKDEKLHSMSQSIIKELGMNVTLIKSASFRYLFDEKSRRVYVIGENREFQAYLNENFGINSEFNYIKNDIEREAEYRGQVSEVYIFSFWDRKTKRLFIDKRDGRVIVLDGRGKETINNGEGGVFFLTPENAEPIELEDPGTGVRYFSGNGLKLKDADVANQSHLLNALTRGLRFTGPLSPHEQKMFLLVIVYLLFFESIHPTKPITLITGPKGSGKTDLSRNIGQILFGAQYDVTYLRDDERDFIAACVRNYLIALDNVEAKNARLVDLIAIIATGGTISLRELHTTCDNIKVRPRVFLLINAIDPKLRRNDIADRLLIFQLDRLSTFGSRATISENIKTVTPKIWGEVLTNLHFIIKRLKTDQVIPEGKFRLQDLEVFSKRICSDPKEVEEILEKMEGLRAEYSLTYDNFCVLLDLVFDTSLYDSIGPITAKDLLDTFRSITEKNKSVQCYFKNAKSLGRKISEIKAELERSYGLVVHHERAGVVKYEFFCRNDG